jgi:hypothetical protein
MGGDSKLEDNKWKNTIILQHGLKESKQPAFTISMGPASVISTVID